jgi:hypothetical protein
MNSSFKNHNCSSYFRLTIVALLILIFSYPVKSQCKINTINNSFELPVIPGSAYLIGQKAVPGWKTTAPDGIIEFWKKDSNLDHLPSFAYDGQQYIELNANYASGLYQDYDSSESTTFNYSFAHRGRIGIDKMVLKAGPPNGPYTLVTTCSTNNDAWKVYSGTYNVPANQKVTRFIFEALSTSTGSPTTGNFLDAINFNSALEKPLVENVPPICAGNSVVLTARSANPEEAETVFTWYNSSKVVIHTGKTFTSGPLFTNTKYSLIKSNSPSCKSDIVEIEVNSGGNPWLGQDILIQQTASASPDQCATLIATIKNNTGSYEYKLDNGNFQPSNKFNNVSSGLHSITVRDPSGCKENFTKEIVVAALQKPVVDDVSPICPDSSVTLTARSVTNGEVGNIFKWYDSNKTLIHTGETFTSPPLLTNTKFSVVQSNSFGCTSDSVETQVKVNLGSTDWSEQDFLIQQTTSVFSHQGANLVAVIKNNNSSFEYKLDNGNFQSSNEFYNVSSGLHMITVKDATGCISYSKEVFVVGYPPFFTPTGDGYNDRWNITNAGNEALSISSLLIFDRYGNF